MKHNRTVSVLLMVILLTLLVIALLLSVLAAPELERRFAHPTRDTDALLATMDAHSARLTATANSP